MKKCLIVCWYGKLPKYYKLWEKSCENNCGGLCGCTCTFCVLYDREIFLTAQSNEVSVQASKLFQEGETCK